MIMGFAVTYVSAAFTAAWSFLRDIFDACGALPFYLAALVIYLFVQSVLLPLRGGRMFSFGSDIAGVFRRTGNSNSKDGK